MSLPISRPYQSIAAGLRFSLRELRAPGVGLWSLWATLVFAITVLAVCTNLTQTIRNATLQSAQNTIGGDLSLRLFHRAPTTQEIAFLKSFGTLSLTAEQRVMVAAPNGETSILAEMKAVDAPYPLYGELTLSSSLSSSDSDNLSSNPPLNAVLRPKDARAPPGVVVAASLLEALHVGIGDVITIGAQDFVIRAVITSEPAQAFRLFSLGPRMIISSDAYAQTHLGTGNAQIYWYARIRLDGAQQAQSQDIIKAIETRFPDAGWRIVDAADGIPGIERINDFAMAFARLIGIAIFVICATGMRNALCAYLDTRQSRFAMLRSMGATRGQVLVAIAAQVACVTLFALVVGGVLSLLIEHMALPVLNNMLGFDIAPSITASLCRFGVIAAFVVLFMAVISIGPLLTACRTSPARLFRHQAERRRAHWKSIKAHRSVKRLVLYGVLVAGLFGLGAQLIGMGWFAIILMVGLVLCLALFAAIAMGLRAGCRYSSRRIINMPPSLRLALRSLAKPGAPTLTVMTSVGVSVTCLMTVMLFAVMAGHHLTSTLPSDSPDLVFFDLPPEDGDAFVKAANAIPRVKSVDQMPFLHGRVTHINQTPISALNVPRRYQWFVRGDRGLSWTDRPHAAAHDTPIVAGAWWAAGKLAERQASLDADIAKALGIQVGDQITVNMLGHPHPVTIANLRKIDWTRLRLDFPIVLSPPSQPVAHDLVSTIDLVADPTGGAPKSNAVASVQGMLKTKFPNVPTILMPDVLEKLEKIFRQVVTAMMTLTVLTTIGACLVVVSGLIALRQDAAKELAMLRALGIQPGQIRQIAAWETGITVASSGIISIALGAGIAVMAALAIGAQVTSFPTTMIGIAMVTVTVLGFGAGSLMQSASLRGQQGWRG